MTARLAAIALLALAAASAKFPAAAADARRAGAFAVETPAAGVHVFRNVEAGFPGVNSLVVERADGLLVVDAQPTPAAARALLTAIAAVTSAPVRYLVLTHPHEDAVGGASAFPKGVLVVASSGAREMLSDPGYDVGAEVRARAPDPAAFKEAERILPVLHASAPVVLDDPQRKVVIYPLPQAHSRGDCLVEVPAAGVMAVGDLVVTDRNPFGGDARIGGWVRALNDLIRGADATVVPLAGPTVDTLEIRRLRDALAYVREEVQQGFTDLVPQDRIVAKVLASPKLGTLYDLAASPSFARTVVEAALAETAEERRKHGLP